ncbi:peroxiredoxin-2-like isoform X2 [Acanthaster planci]|uniref:thioredoxin-dependent peroxiredoxin n=1 Tax=Acanthaster planci TaxID=133434 RepID=A0A8B7Y270_ACAPL|nr:peroxiredoxin-2-like isoform X2 [Acanthaster planci]
MHATVSDVSTLRGAFSLAQRGCAHQRLPAVLATSKEQQISSYASRTYRPQARLLSTTSRLNVGVQHAAPSFVGTAVVNGDFKTVRLEDYRGKYLVLFFYPLDFTFVCPTEIIAFSERASEFHQLNTEVVGVSVDSHFSHLAWINTPRKEGGLGPMNIPLLSDFKKEISKDYGVLLYEEGVALRGLFIIDPDGIVRHTSVNDLPVGRSVDETLRLVKAFQFVAKHGEVCPAGWTPDSPTIKPDPHGSKTYFEEVNK